MDFAKGFETDDSERAKLWDIQDQKIEAHGKKIVDVMLHGQANESPFQPASKWMCLMSSETSLQWAEC